MCSHKNAYWHNIQGGPTQCTIQVATTTTVGRFTSLLGTKGENMGRNSRQMGYSSPFRCEIKSIIDNCNIIGSDGSRAGVDEETTIVCLQRRRTDGVTAVRGLDDNGRVFLVAKFLYN